MIAIAFIIGTMLGANAGILLMGILVAARRADDNAASFSPAAKAVNDNPPAQATRKGAA